MRGGSQNFSIKAAPNGDYVINFGTGDIVCNREFFTMTEDRPIVKEVSTIQLIVKVTLSAIASAVVSAEK